VNLWKVQNLFYEMMQTTYPELQQKAGQGDQKAGEWTKQFASLGEQLSIRMPK